MIYMIVFDPMDVWYNTLLSIYLVRIIFNVTWCTRSTGALYCGFLIVVKTGLISKPFNKVVKYRLNSYTFVKNDFVWTRVSNKRCVVKQQDNPGRLFVYVIIITFCNLIEVVCQYLNNFESACGGVDNHHTGETKISFNDINAILLLSYRLTIWDYQVHMHKIPRF